MKIQQSTDYQKFATITGNRNVSEKKIENIISDIENGLNLLPYAPIIVYDDESSFQIVDGQHRAEVSQRLKRPIFYVVCEKIDLKQIARLNSRSDKWSIKDFLSCYVKIGVPDYIKLRDFVSEYKLNISTASRFLENMKAQTTKDHSENFRNGEFSATFPKEATELVELSHGLFDRYTFYTDRNLIEAVRRIKKKGLCDFDILKEKIDKWPMGMDKQSSTMDYVFNIERVYNHNNQNRKVIY